MSKRHIGLLLKQLAFQVDLSGRVAGPLEQGAVLDANRSSPRPGVVPQAVLYGLPDRRIDDALVLAFVNLVTEVDLADVDHIGQQIVEPVLGELPAAGWRPPVAWPTASAASPDCSGSGPWEPGSHTPRIGGGQ